MLSLYRGDPKNDGILIGYFEDITEVQCAIYEDSRNHESGTAYYFYSDEEDGDGKPK